MRKASAFCSCRSWDVSSTATRQKSELLQTPKFCSTTTKTQGKVFRVCFFFLQGRNATFRIHSLNIAGILGKIYNFLYFYSGDFCSSAIGLSPSEKE